MVREKVFISRVRKGNAGEGVVSLYIRLQNRCELITESVRSKTPYEFAAEFEKKTGYDISEFMYLLEKVKYREKDITSEDVEVAVRIYKDAVVIYNKWKKRKKDKH